MSSPWSTCGSIPCVSVDQAAFKVGEDGHHFNLFLLKAEEVSPYQSPRYLHSGLSAAMTALRPERWGALGHTEMSSVKTPTEEILWLAL